MILAMDETPEGSTTSGSLKLISYLLGAVEFSTYDEELLGYALFQGHLCVVEALVKRMAEGSLDKAYLGYLTREHLISLSRLSRQDVEEHLDELGGPVNIALMSGDTKVIDYVSNKYPIKASEFTKAAEFGKLNSLKHIYSPSAKASSLADALAISLRSSWPKGVQYLMERVPTNAYSKDTVMASLEYGDSKVFAKILGGATLNQQDIKEIADEINRGSYTKEMEILMQDPRSDSLRHAVSVQPVQVTYTQHIQYMQPASPQYDITI